MRACDSLSITQGPAKRNSGWPAAGRSDAKENALDWLMEVTQDSIPEGDRDLPDGQRRVPALRLFLAKWQAAAAEEMPGERGYAVALGAARSAGALGFSTAG